MERVITISIDKGTWPGPGTVPLFPRNFHSGSNSYTINIPAMLMMIGYLTTPTSSTGVSLSEFWAWVRYIAAVSQDRNMSLTQAFAQLDAHQKTILSDDFGMGVPMLWLTEKLSMEEIVDGRYFMQKLAASIGATQRRTAKRGPNKTPDFVARDSRGQWHVIECKGTQSGIEFSQKQLGSKGPPPTGGVAQKCSIRFPTGHTGQRLVCGLSIDVEGGSGSVLKIVDPEPEDPFEIKNDHLVFAEAAASRGVMSRALRMAGYETTAETVASPFGRTPDIGIARSTRARRDQEQMIKDRMERSEREIRDRYEQATITGDFVGREINISLPREIGTDDGVIKRVIIKQEINRDALYELERRPTPEELADEEPAPWAELTGRTFVESDGPMATMKIGDIFRSKIILTR